MSRFSAKDLIEMMRDVRAGAPLKVVCHKYKISRSQLYRYRTRLESIQWQPIMDAELENKTEHKKGQTMFARKKKEVLLGHHGQMRIIAGLDKLADAVQVTLGPTGRCVILGNMLLPPRPTKDGVTIARHISFEDPYENMGAELVKEAALGAVKEVGDGTTTAVVLARALVHKLLPVLHRSAGKTQKGGDGTDSVDEGVQESWSARDISSLLEQTARWLCSQVDLMKKEIETEEEAIQIATLAANGDKVLGNLIGKVGFEVGKHGLITAKESGTHSTWVEKSNGFELDCGLLNDQFINNTDYQSCDFMDARVLLCKGEVGFTMSKVFKEMLTLIFKDSNSVPLVVIADAFSPQIMDMILANVRQLNIQICLVKAPAYGDTRQSLMEDLGVLTGAKVLEMVTLQSRTERMEDLFGLQDLGTVSMIRAGMSKTTLQGGGGNPESIKLWVDELEKKAKILTDKVRDEAEELSLDILKKRLANFNNGVALIHLGGETASEFKEKADRVDDAIQAVRSALVDGIVPGGGMVLVRLAVQLPYFFSTVTIKPDWPGPRTAIQQALVMPFHQICENGGEDPKALLKDMDAQHYLTHTKDYYEPIHKWMGLDASTGAITNLMRRGIIDPAAVVKTAIMKAFAVAATILSAGAIVGDVSEV